MFRELKRVFFTDGEPRRLRSGWRLGLFVLLVLVLTGPITMVAALLAAMAGWAPQSLPALLLGQFAFVVALTLATVIMVRWLDRRPWASVGLVWDARAPREILLGIGLASAQMVLLFVLVLALGWGEVVACTWQTWTWTRALREFGQAFLLWGTVAWAEELMLRGYVLQTLEDGLGTLWAWLAQALIFAILHVLNPAWGPGPALGLTLAGLYLGQAYLATRRLWLPMGLHLGWNWAEASLGFPVSGLTNVPMRLIDLRVYGPERWTGGAFGPEGGLLGVFVIVLGMVALHQWARRSRAPSRPEA